LGFFAICPGHCGRDVKYPLVIHKLQDGETEMDLPEREYLLDLWAKNICPWCGNSIPEGKRVGSGRKADGGFCSVACYANYHSLELGERARKVSEIAKKHGRL
jgi:hypothetical protein